MKRLFSQSRIRSAADILFIFLFVAFLLAGGIRAIVHPKAVNRYENRTANQMPKVEVSAMLTGSFQDKVESALHDQVLFAQTMESDYLYLDSAFQMKMIEPFLVANPNRYVNVLGLKTFDGTHLVYSTYHLSDKQETLDRRIEHINQTISANQDLDFYLYYIEKETDLDLATGEKSGLAEYVRDGVETDTDHFGVFEINDFAAFDRYFFRTDHHWNYLGAYLGYCQVLSLLTPEEMPLSPAEEMTLEGYFSGSKATTIGADGIFKELFPVYRFEYPAMEISINGQIVSDYGNQEAFQTKKETDDPTYGGYYGGDHGEILFRTNQPERENLLVIGESYDNAILKLLASHYNETCSIDLRHYENTFGEPFRLSEYVQQHQITKVLLIGNADYFLLDTFNLEE